MEWSWTKVKGQKSMLCQYHVSLYYLCPDHVFSLLDSTWLIHQKYESVCVKRACSDLEPVFYIKFDYRRTLWNPVLNHNLSFLFSNYITRLIVCMWYAVILNQVSLSKAKVIADLSIKSIFSTLLFSSWPCLLYASSIDCLVKDEQLLCI